LVNLSCFCLDIFWRMAAELGFAHVDVEPIKTVDMMEAL
jgi:hypothetical protein